MTTVINPEAYQLLKKEIDKRGLKRNYVAQEIGISQTYLSQVLNGSRKLSTDVAIKASRVLELPLDIFLKNS